MAEFDAPQSRNEAILQNILGADNVLVDPQSRIEAILQAILYGTAYTDEPQSRMEELLLCILNGESTDMEPISRNEAILIAKINGDSYTEEPQSRIEELLIAWLNAYIEKTVTGNPITVNDAVAQNVMALLAEFVPAQDLHGYSEPWPAGGGKNIFDASTVPAENKYVNAQTGKLQTPSSETTRFRHSTYIPIRGGESYYFGAVMSSATSAGIAFYSEAAEAGYISGLSNSQLISSDNVFTAPATATHVRVSINIGESYNPEWETTVYVTLNSNPHEWSPYSNVCPITGYTGVTVTREGKNIFDEANADWVNQQYLDASGQESSSQAYRYTNNYIQVDASTQYAFSYNKTNTPSSALTVCEYDENKTFIQRQAPIAETTATGTLSGTMTTTATTKYIRFSISRLYSANIQIEKGNAATTYQPYGAPATVSVTFPNTVYGGTVDFTTGMVTVDKAYKHCTKDDTWYLRGGNNDYLAVKLGELNTIIAGADNTYCDTFPYVSISVNNTNKGIATSNSSSYGGAFLNVRPTWAEPAITLQDFIDWITNNPFDVVYALATPIEIPLTPQTLAMLAGTNILQSADGKTITLTYKATPSADAPDTPPLLGGFMLGSPNPSPDPEPTEDEPEDLIEEPLEEIPEDEPEEEDPEEE